ncbi:MAG TPA: hypothetical protein VGV57_04040 [Thermoleophilaceae bacterium]|nr:hypothetical protein [Thermoleophilaceae bacterium]
MGEALTAQAELSEQGDQAKEITPNLASSEPRTGTSATPMTPLEREIEVLGQIDRELDEGAACGSFLSRTEER